MIDPILVKTPIQRLPLPDDTQNRFWIKRDDLLPFSFGGNKVRIAASFLEDCVRRGYDAMILYGDRRSNLCRVLSSMCAASGIDAIMIETSEHEEDAAVPFNEKMIRSLGTRILPCEKSGIKVAVERAMDLLRREGKKPYYIYGNSLGEGNEGTAVDAYVRACPEILSWEAQNDISFDYVFTACGTGSTLAGLTVGMLERKSKASVIGISISSRTPERAQSCLDRAARAWYEREHKEAPRDLSSHLHLETAYHCGGYGVKDPRVLDLIRTVFHETSVPLDPTYTGKALRGMLDDLAKRQIRGKNILFLHTGGTPLFFDDLAAES